MQNSDAPKAERSTRQRAAIREAIEQAGRPLLAQEVLELACLHVPRLGIATVYRNIKAMVEEGAIKQVLLPGENPRFELAGHDTTTTFNAIHARKSLISTPARAIW